MTGASAAGATSGIKVTGGVGGSSPSAGSANPAATPAIAPSLQLGEFSLAPTNLDPSLAPKISITEGPVDSKGNRTLTFKFESSAMAEFGADGAVAKVGDRNQLSISMTVGQDKDSPAYKAAVSASTMLASAAKLVSSSEANETVDRNARLLIDRAISAFHGTDAHHNRGVWTERSDARLKAIEKYIADKRPELETSSTPTANELATSQCFADLALGVDRIKVSLKDRTTATEGDVETLQIAAGRMGVDVDARGFRNKEVSKKKIEREEQRLAGHMEQVALFNAGSQASVEQHHNSTVVKLKEMLPAANSTPGSPDLIGSDAGWSLVNHVGLSKMTNQVIRGYGHVHEKLSPDGALLDNVTVADGVFYIEGRLKPGSKIIVKEGATLMLDLEPGSDVELIIEKGAKIMSGPGGRGISGCRVSGEIHGDASELHMKGVQWGSSMTVKSFDGMIFDASKVDESSRKIFWEKSKEFTGIAGLQEADLKNLSGEELKKLLAERFDVRIVSENGQDVGFVIDGEDPKRFVYVRPNDEGKIVVAPGVVTPGEDHHTLSDAELKKRANPTRYDTSHQALVAALGSLHGVAKEDKPRIETDMRAVNAA